MSQPIINSEGKEIPENTLLLIPYLTGEEEKQRCLELLQPLVGEKKRDWMSGSMFRCLPMLISNQYGFVIRAENDFSVLWNGGNTPDDVEVFHDQQWNDVQEYKSHFGWATVTIEHRWLLRTPLGVNLMTVQPPNWFKRGVHHMTGVIETDNLRRNFIFNLKITEPDLLIHFKKGEPIASFILIPRYFVDSFSLHFADEFYTPDEIATELSSGDEHERLRSIPGSPENHYRRGVDAFENPFSDHQVFIRKPKK